MTKTQILAEIAAKPFVNKIVSLIEESVMQDGTKLYNANVLETVGNSGKINTFTFFVLDEGLETESAFYKDSDPLTSTVKTFESKLKPLLVQFNAKVIDKGDTWALCETNTIVVGTPNSILKESYFVVDGETLAITKIG